MPEATHPAGSTPYASSDDFCRIFNQEMDGFYLLSFLLTADREKAEQCFVSGLEDSMKGNPVFKEWARSWARRAVIQNAVRAVNPRPAETADCSSSASVNSDAKEPLAEQEEIAAVTGARTVRSALSTCYRYWNTTPTRTALSFWAARGGMCLPREPVLCSASDVQ